MASSAYFTWLASGKPLSPARPIREMVERLRVAFPRGEQADLFSWYANDAHYQAVPPQDHTPFSATGWPLTSPRWIVFATDVMHRPDLGVDCRVLAAYWLREARAGRMPWLKYMIWQRKIYDVRNSWRAADADGHDDHIHLSGRTDHQFTTLGGWSIVPTATPVAPMGDDMMRFRIKGLPGTPAGVDGRVHVSDGITWRVLGIASDIDELMDAATGRPIVEVTPAKVPAGWDYNRVVGQLCGWASVMPGTFDPDELDSLTMAVKDAAHSGAVEAAPALIAAVVTGIPAPVVDVAAIATAVADENFRRQAE